MRMANGEATLMSWTNCATTCHYRETEQGCDAGYLEHLTYSWYCAKGEEISFSKIWGFITIKVKVIVTQSDSATSWTVVRQVPLSMGFSRQEYWGGLPLPTPGDSPNHWTTAGPMGVCIHLATASRLQGLNHHWACSFCFQLCHVNVSSCPSLPT